MYLYQYLFTIPRLFHLPVNSLRVGLALLAGAAVLRVADAVLGLVLEGVGPALGSNAFVSQDSYRTVLLGHCRRDRHHQCKDSLQHTN